MSRFIVRNLPLYSFHSSFRGGKIEKERRRSFSIHKDSIYFNVFSVKNTTQIHKRNFIFVHISNMINQFAQRILHFIVKFYFKFSSLFSPRNFSSAKSKFKPYPTTFSCSIRIIFQYLLPPKKQHKRSHPAPSCRLIINRMFRYRVTAIESILTRIRGRYR